MKVLFTGRKCNFDKINLEKIGSCDFLIKSPIFLEIRSFFLSFFLSFNRDLAAGFFRSLGRLLIFHSGLLVFSFCWTGRSDCLVLV